MNAVYAQQQTMVYLEYSETLSFDEKRLPDAQILCGNVCFRHDSALMYCDSAYFFEKTNSLTAFSHVRMIQGDTLSGYGDILYYDGNSKIARLRKHVRLVHNNTTLTTDSLNYNRTTDIAYYFSGGQIQDSLNTLVSRWGQYTPYNSQALFRNDVELTNPKFILTADSLKYNTKTNIANLVGPTKIIYEEQTTILSINGIYNTQTEQSELYDRSHIIHSEGKDLTGDTIIYNKATGFGQVKGNIVSIDSINKATLYGEYGEVYEQENRGFITHKALMVDWSDSTNYSYLHADTLFTEQVAYQIDSLMPDSTTLTIDTAYRQLRAHYNVRVFRDDMQAVCDSAIYNGKDSILFLYSLPVCWSDSMQISADSMRIYVKNKTVDYLYGMGNAIAVQQLTDQYFNQIAGKEMYAYVENDELTQVEVIGNAETIFYPDDQGDYIGLNTTQSSHVNIYLQDRKVDHVLFTTETTGTLFPLDQIPDGKQQLSGFFWATQERPLRAGDVLEHPQRTQRPNNGTISAIEIEEETVVEPLKKEKRNKRKR